MKRALIIIAILAAFAVPAFGQATASSTGVDAQGSIRNPSDLYPVRVDIVKVFSHAQGYRVLYRKGTASFADVYIPVEWFVAGGKAQLIRAHGPEYPYMVVYYRSDGSFSHVKLYVMENVSDPSWGTLDGDPGDRFKVDTVKLQY